MKTIKYIICFFILFIGVLIIGESHIFRLDSFSNQFYNTTLFLQEDTTEKEMINDVIDSAVYNEVKVFIYIRSPRSTFITDVDIYGTKGVEEYINENLDIYEQEYSSLILGDIHVTFNDIENVPGIGNIHNFYAIGSKEQVHQFKMDLIDKYAGNHPKDGYVSNDTRNNIVLIWLLILSIILLFSYYDIVSQKKETLIRVTMGEKVSRIILYNILLDSFAFSAMYTIILVILSKYTYVFFRFDISLLLFCVLLFSNALLYINLYFYNLKEVFSNVIGDKKLLTLNYFLKFFSTIITIFIISSNVVMIFQSYELYKQKSFFEDHADYYYTQLTYKPTINSDGSFISRFDDSINVQTTFYKEYFEEFNGFYLSNTSNFLDVECILANKNAFDYLSNEINELSDYNLNKEIYFLLPQKMSGDAKIIDKLNDTIRFYEGDHFVYDYDVIYYDDNVDIISIDENYTYGSKFIKNPVIIYNNMAADVLEGQAEDDSQKINYLHEIMYKISDDEFNRFIDEHDLNNQIVTQTNVLEKYNNMWMIAKRILFINLIFSMLVLCLELIIIGSIIKLEYEVNAIELSIKKVIGYSILEKNRKIIFLTLFTSVLSVISAVVIAIILKLEGVYYLAVGGFVILFLELCVIGFYIQRIEYAKIHKILKGGNI